MKQLKHIYRIKSILLIIFLQCSVNLCLAQSKEEIALQKGLEAIKLMENGEIEKSLVLLEEAKKLDPENINYPYEIAYAHFLDKNYKVAIKTLEGIKKRKNVTDQVYQLLGNIYSISEQRPKAITTYEEGIKKFPNSGRLYLERGNVELFIKDYVKALNFYEKGIKAEPEFPSNYYWASKIYCNSSEEVWGMIYGEIFMNLERNSKRTAEISQLLFDTYKSEIKFTSDTTFSVSFSKNATIDISKMSDPANIKLPFGTMVYETTLIMTLIEENNIDITSLDRIRTRFLDAYYNNGHHDNYPNILFDYQKKVHLAGHLEAYNHWILMKGDEEGFDNWYNENEEKWNRFTDWFTNNPMQVNINNHFHSSQY